MKHIHIILSFVMLASALSGCAADPIPSMSVTTLTITDGLNRTITLDIPAQRIVSLAPSNTELIYDVGAGSQLVGRDSFSNYPEEANQIQEIGGSMGQYNYEAITALQPDLVLAAEINTPEQVRSLETLGLTVYYLANPLDFDGLYENIRIVGQLSGHEPEAETLAGNLEARVREVQVDLAGATTSPTVYYELDATDPAQPYTLGSGTFGDYLISMAGGTNIGATIGKGWVQVSSEQILQSDPELILLGDVYSGVNPESLAARPGWDVLSAVRNGRVVPFNDDLMSRPTARLVDGLEALALLLHPEVFQD